MITDAQRIKRFNYPSTQAGIESLELQVRVFINKDINKEYRFEIFFTGGDGAFRVGTAMIKVFHRPLNSPLEVTPLLGVYNATEVKKFESDINRVTQENTSGVVELAPNLLFNGLFNAFPNPIEGWGVESDTTGDLVVVGNLGRMEISATSIGSFSIVNSVTELVNLVEFEVIISINKIVGANVSILLGSTPTTVRSSVGVYTEDLISGGADVSIDGNMTSPDAKISLDYIIINRNS